MKSIRQWTIPPLPECDAPTRNASVPGVNKRKQLASMKSPSALTERHIQLLWERMAKIYGHKWVSSFGVLDDGTWLLGLCDVTPEQISVGLEHCRTRADAWPPTLPEFRSMCRAMAMPYRRPTPRLPKSPSTPELADRELNKMKQLLRKSRP